MAHTPTNRDRANGADATRSKPARIERLRKRLAGVDADPGVVSVIKGILDLLEDEL